MAILKQLWDPRGNTTTYAYDLLNQLLSETYPAVNATSDTKTYSYDYSNRAKTIINENGEKIKEYTDSQGNVVSRLEYSGNSLVRTTSFFYDALGNIIKTIDGNGGETVYTYNERNQETSITIPEAEFSNGVATYTAAPRFVTAYNKDGFKVSETTYKNGKACLIEYEPNGLGQVIKTTAHYTDADETVSTSVTKSIFDETGNEVKTYRPKKQCSYPNIQRKRPGAY